MDSVTSPAPALLFPDCLGNNSERLQIIIKLVHQRDSGGNVEFNDLFMGDMIEVFDETSQAVSVRNDENALALTNCWRNHFVQVRAESGDHILEALRQRGCRFSDQPAGFHSGISGNMIGPVQEQSRLPISLLGSM